MPSDTFLKGRDEIVKQNLDWEGSASIVAIPMSDSYTPDFVTQDFVSDVAADELDATGYDGGFGGADRKTPANKTIVRDDANERIELDHDDVTLADIGGTVNDTNDVVSGYILAEERSSDSDSPLIAFLDLTDDRPTNGSDITLSPDAEGAIQLT